MSRHDEEQGEHAGRGAQSEGDGHGSTKVFADIQVAAVTQEAVLVSQAQARQGGERVWHGIPPFLLQLSKIQDRPGRGLWFRGICNL